MIKFSKTLVFGALLTFNMQLALALDKAPILNKNHPDSYTVKTGDTLWDISAKFLKEPEMWPKVWRENPKIADPNKIYPGDVIILAYDNGEPTLSLGEEVSKVGETVKLSPHTRVTALQEAVPTIPIKAIRPFLNKSIVVNSEDALKEAPTIIARVEEHVITGAGDEVYVNHVDLDNSATEYSIYREGRPYVHPVTKEILGYEALYVGTAEVVTKGEPAKFYINNSEFEVMTGDKLQLTSGDLIEPYFPLIYPDNVASGYILAVFGGVSQIGQYQVVVVSGGEREGRKAGEVLGVYKVGGVVVDKYKKTSWWQKDKPLQLPEEKAGKLVLFRVFDKVSLGIIMQASLPININDKIAKN